MARILVVEDNEDLRLIIKDILEDAGHDISQACDGAEVEEILSIQPVDLVLTDIIMPEQEGIQTIIRLRKQFPDLKIIGMSGGGSLGNAEYYLEMAQEFGANAALQKPFSKTQLIETIQELIGCPTS